MFLPIKYLGRLLRISTLLVIIGSLSLLKVSYNQGKWYNLSIVVPMLLIGICGFIGEVKRSKWSLCICGFGAIILSTIFFVTKTILEYGTIW
jgi:hypothetical protein